jgi:hypothetical protein
MKMRLGYDTTEEILDVLSCLRTMQLRMWLTRVGKQLYKGGVHFGRFSNCIDQSNIKLYYNGDITSVASFKRNAGTFSHY